MKKRNRYIRQVICILMVLSLLMGFTACVEEPLLQTNSTASVQTQPTSSTVGQTTVPSTAATQPTDPTPTTQPTEPPEPPLDENALVFTLTEEDVTEYYRLLDECEKLSIEGLDTDAIDASMTALDEKYEFINSQVSIANILYYSAMSNETLKQQYLDTVETFTDANDAYIQMARRVYLSDTPAKDMLFEGWTQEDIDHLLAYDERITELQQRNSEIKVSYQNSYNDEEKINLYIEFVGNNNEIAQFYGYDNYYDYAYELVYDRDYGRSELKKMRKYAQKYLADAIGQAMTNFENSFYSLDATKQNTIVEFLYNDYNTLPVNYVNKYLNVVPQSMSDHSKHMLEADSLFANANDAMAGAFTTAIGDRSYCFFGPGYANSCTVIHEAGHYYASRYDDLSSIPLDLAETHSQGNEWLFMAYLRRQMPLAVHQAMVDYRMYNDLAMILICLMVDEFEQRVYTTDLTGFTAEDFDAIMESVCTQYFSVIYCKANIVDIMSYWRMVVVEQPVYYISYAVSSVAAMDFYTIAKNDFTKGLATYQKLCEEPVLEEGFLANIKQAGLSSPFDEEVYKNLVALIGG